MKPECRSLRAELEGALAGETALAGLVAHPHARACAACGAAVRLELVREGRLDALLARWSVAAPVGLAARALARLGPERARHAGRVGLDELLAVDRGRASPEGLAARVLRRLAPARARARRRLRLRSLVLAAGLLFFLGLLAWSARRGPADERLVGERAGETRGGPEVDRADAEEDLLVYALERWELLQDGDLDVWLASLDPVDELLLSDGVLLDARAGGEEGGF